MTVRESVSALASHHAGVYLDLLDRDDGDRAAEAFSAATCTRLATLRQQWDPDGVLRPGTALLDRST